MNRFNKKRQPAQDDATYPVANPDLFGRLQPEIDAVCDEWIRAGVRMPKRESVELMTKRVFDNMVNKFPDMADFARMYDRNMPYVQGQAVSMFGVDVSVDSSFSRLIAFLLLAGFFFRRRRFRR